jgi:membrane protein
MLGKRIAAIINRIERNIFVSASYKFVDDEGLEYAGYMAYLNIFSIFPLFIIIIASLTFFGETEIGIQAVSYMADLIPEYALKVIKPQIISLMSGPSVGVISFVFIGALWTTTSTLEGLRKIFNKMYHVKQPPLFIVSRLLSIAQFLIAMVVLLVTLAAFILLPGIVGYIESVLNITIPSIQSYYLNKFYTFIILTAIIAVVYYSLTNKKLRFISVFPGALMTVLLWFLCGEGLAYYMYNFQNFDIVYGSLAGAIITLLFFYMVNVSLLYGVAFNVILLQRLKWLRKS